MKLDWTGTLLPYIRLLERTGDPQNIAAATHMRDVQLRMVEAAGRFDVDAMGILMVEMDHCFEECSPNVQEQLEKAAEEVKAEGYVVREA
jgi:hypothetical protein